MRVLVTGGTGFLGRALVRALYRRDDRVTVHTRDTKGARAVLPRDVRVAKWDPLRPGPWQQELGVVDAVVHLAGSPVSVRWTTKTQRRMVQSRVDSAKLMVQGIEQAKKKPAVFVSASGTGYYGASRKREVDESSERGTGFAADLCRDWEAAARAVEKHDVRSVQLRIGLVLGDGGALDLMLAPKRMFVTAPIGDGANTMSWVHIDDVVGMLLWAIDNEQVSGAINCTTPHHTTGRELADLMGSVMGRRSIAVPESVVRFMLGDLVEMLVGNLEVYPRRAVDLGYEYHHTQLVPALEAALMPDGG
jgi:uncharacterized protein (TIGR01777 family)